MSLDSAPSHRLKGIVDGIVNRIRPEREYLDIREDLEFLFGAQAQIEISKTEENSPHKLHIVIRSKLEDGEFIEGGQELLVTTHEPVTLTFKNIDGVKTRQGYLVDNTSISIDNHTDIFENMTPILLAEPLTANGGHAGHAEEAIRGVENRVNILPKLSSADDIAVLLHEDGHHQTMEGGDNIEHEPYLNCCMLIHM